MATDLKKFSPFNLSPGENRRPWEIALEAMIDLGLQPGDEIKQSDISKMLCMVPFESLANGFQTREYDMRRLPQVERLREEFTEATGLLLRTNYAGSYVVLHPDDISERLENEFAVGQNRLIRKAEHSLKHASRDGASHSELQRRQGLSDFVSGVKDYLRRPRRKSLGEA